MINEYAEKIASIRSGIPNVEIIVTVGDSNQSSEFMDYHTIFETEHEFFPCAQLKDDDPGMIVYTSGTTGRPKGAVLTHKNLILGKLILLWEIGTPMYSKQLIVPPMFHAAAMGYLIRGCMIVGTSVIHRDFQPENILTIIEKEKINTMFLVPAMWNFLLRVPNVREFDLTSMRECSTGGAITPLELKKRIIKVFENASYSEAFGQTEMSPSTTSLNGNDSYRKTDSVGKPIPNVEVRIVDEEMNDVPIGEIGEIVYRGPTVMKEYYNNPEATREAFRGGWFHSGDLVRMDEEGFIYVVDRKKDMIISGGENIYSAEIEEVLYTHPDILECAVIGVPDIHWGERVKAYIVMKPEKKLTEQEVIAYCKKSLASYKKPKEVEFIDTLPRNASGKVLKTTLRGPHKNSSKQIQGG
ncbi:AMP-binding protein [Lentibacillus sp. L22]|uniref:AMP-binding protein n=1 Tax=Lentibacillus sp. L22 TaxID=3163028 RepID=UPI00346713B3